MNKPFLRALFCAICISLFSVQTQAYELTVGNYKLNINESTGKVNIYQGSTQIIKDSQLSFKVNSSTYSLASGTVTESALSDALGSGRKVVFKGTVNGWTVEHNFYLYSSKNHIATDFTVEISSGTLSSNRMTPIKSSAASFGANRVLRVPFDNDDFIRYESNSLSGTTKSYEVTAVYNESTTAHQGLIIGSIEHDTWKTGVEVSSGSIEVYGGIADGNTRDYYEHRPVKLKKIKSPKIFIGYYTDWRSGLEDYGKANRLIAPKYYNWSGSFNGKKPFGWNSWAGYDKYPKFSRVDESSQWIKNNIQSVFKTEDNTFYMGLDSYWNESDHGDYGFGSQSDLEQFVKNCHARGQKAGVYLAPFSHWGNDAPPYALKVNGQPKKLDGGWCIDPTDQRTKDRATSEFLNRIKNAGFDYIKVDFLSHASMEADYWADSNVQTGIQAYNHGMKWLADWFKNNMPNMYVNLSIAPLFPGQYAHSRRISCDAFAHMTGIVDGWKRGTEYVLNSLSYGWWLDYVYDYNDADHVQLKNASEGENRARITSSAITGIFILGDAYHNGADEGVKDRSKRLLTNTDIVQMAQQTKAFRPLRSSSGDSAAEIFYQTGGGYTYVAIFNYNGSSKAFTINAAELGLSSSYSFPVKELWNGATSTLNGTWTGTVPAKDCFVLRINSCTDPADSDGDGVPDCWDLCPGTPAGTKVDEHGCTYIDPCSIDSDGDGVPDCEDQCPDTPAGTKVDKYGCPPPPPCNRVADFENGTIGSGVSIARRSNSNQLTVDGVVTNPSKAVNSTEKVFKATTSSSWNNHNTWETGIDITFKSAIAAGSYIHLAFYTTLNKIEFPERSNVSVGGSTIVKGTVFNELKPIAQNQWFDVVVPMPSGLSAGGVFTIWIDSRSDENNQSKVLYIDEIEVNTSSAPRTSIAVCSPDCTDPTDSDGDGVPDCKDSCPNTPKGTKVDASGCPDLCAIDSDGDGVPDCQDLCPGTPKGTAVNADGCPKSITTTGMIANFDNVQLTSYTGDANIAAKEVRNVPANTDNCTAKALYVETNTTVGSGEAQYKSGITLNFPSFNTQSSEWGRYMHFLFKTNMEKVEFLINGSWDKKFNPRTEVTNNGWFDYVLDLGSEKTISQITILFDMRTGSDCDISSIGASYNNHNKYMYIDEIIVNNSSAKRSPLTNCDIVCPGDPSCPPVCPGDPSCPSCDYEGANIADFESGAGKMSFLIYGGTEGITLNGIVDNPRSPLEWNYTSKAYKITTASNYGSLNSGKANPWESGIQLSFNEGLNAGDYLHFAIYTNMDKIEFWDAGAGEPRVIFASGIGTGFAEKSTNSLKPIAQNQWFEVIVKTQSMVPGGDNFSIMFDPRSGSGADAGPNNGKYIYFDEVTKNNSSTLRSVVGCKPCEGCVGINSLGSNNWTAYVNADKQIVVNTSYSENTALNTIKVYNISGKKIVEQMIKSTETVINTHLDTGIYLVQWYQDNSVKTAKVIIF